MGANLARDRLVIVNFICQLDWAKGCPDSGEDIISGCVCVCFQKRSAFEPVD